MTAPAYSNPLGIAASRTKVLVCATVIEEMLARQRPEPRHHTAWQLIGIIHGLQSSDLPH